MRSPFTKQLSDIASVSALLTELEKWKVSATGAVPVLILMVAFGKVYRKHFCELFTLSVFAPFWPPVNTARCRDLAGMQKFHGRVA